MILGVIRRASRRGGGEANNIKGVEVKGRDIYRLQDNSLSSNRLIVVEYRDILNFLSESLIETFAIMVDMVTRIDK